MSQYDDIMLKGEKVNMPSAMTQNMLEKIHTGHMDIERSKQKARDALFWPEMGKTTLQSTRPGRVIKPRSILDLWIVQDVGGLLPTVTK